MAPNTVISDGGRGASSSGAPIVTSFKVWLCNFWMLSCCSGDPLDTGAREVHLKLSVGRLDETGSSFLFALEGAEGVG